MFCFVVVAIVVIWCMYVSWCTYVCMYVVFGKCPRTGIHAFWYNPFLCNWINQIIIIIIIVDDKRYSSLRKLLRITIYCLKFIKRMAWHIYHT